MELQQILKDGSWGYVANQRGGFLGFWWNFIEKDGITMHLQIETEQGQESIGNETVFNRGKLCFKIRVDEEAKRADYRWKLYSYILEESKKYNLPVKKPDRFGKGLYMTVAIVDIEIRKNKKEIIDMDSTVEYIKKVMDFLNVIIKQFTLE
jgi:hypothetical protein